MIFRRANEKIGTDLDALDAQHRSDGNADLVHDTNMKLHFQCECSDENCTVRIPLQLSKYREIHKERSTFIVLPQHEIDEIEKVIEKSDGYNIVRKNNKTDEPGDVLNITKAKNN